MLNDKDKNELSLLIIELLDGTISDERLAKLDDWLRHSTAAFDYYCSYTRNLMVLKHQLQLSDISENGSVGENILQSLARNEQDAPEIILEKIDNTPIPQAKAPDNTHTSPNKFYRLYSKIISIAAVLMIIFIVYANLFPPQYITPIAKVIDQVDAQWSQDIEPLNNGDRIYTNQPAYKLKSGIVKILYDYGAEVLIEGPAEFKLVDAEKMILDSGRIYVSVPPRAAGFTAVTPTGTIIDLGTEFGVSVAYDGSTDVHMFKGKASVIPGMSGQKEKGLLITAGQAKNVDRAGDVADIQVNTNEFIDPELFRALSKVDKNSPYYRWLVYSINLRRDPSLVAYYTFDKNDSHPGILENKASLTGGRLNGKLYSAVNGELPAWVEGRWPQKSALSFNRSERQVVTVPGIPELYINGPITIAAWVRCDTPEDGGHIVSCRQSSGNKTGNFQFGFKSPKVEDSAWAGKIQLGRMEHYGATAAVGDRVYSNRTFSPSPNWRFVAATHDNHTAKFYVDGKMIECLDFNYHKASVAADLVIGADDIMGDPLRFTGEMDELMIFNSVINEKEISEIYKAGRPF